MNSKTLNITNGEYFNEYFISRFGGVAVPFCEAMMDGDVVSDIYSEEFIALRAKSLNVSENEYRDKMYACEALNNKTYDKICLWFGEDTFCQVNLFTLLAYLEKIQYRGKVKLNYIDDETFAVLKRDIDVKLGVYGKIYQDVLISKCMPSDVGVLNARAIDLYFDYHSENGMLANLVRENSRKAKNELIVLLLEKSKEYGLSDLQAERLIKSNKSFGE